jgi:two-component system heavy metal sensor histidine kinase CusS
MAHALCTPLTSLRTNCEVTLRKKRSPEKLRQALESVLRTTMRMNELVQDLVALSRLPQESAVAPSHRVDLTESVREAARLHASTAEAKAVPVDLVLAPQVSVQGSAGLLVECVSNLLENAIRYAPEGGTVTVRADASPSPRVTVRDSGCGIREAHLEQIFERFYRVDPGRSRSDGGGPGWGWPWCGRSCACTGAR